MTGASSFETYTSDTAPIYRTFLHNEGDEKTVRIPDPGNEDDVDYMLTPANLSFVKDGDKWYWYKRIILPYSAFTPVTNSDYGIQLRATVWGKPYLLTLSNQAETDFTISRNSRYKVNANLSPNFIQFEVSVLPWGDNTNVDIPFN